MPRYPRNTSSLYKALLLLGYLIRQKKNDARPSKQKGKKRKRVVLKMKKLGVFGVPTFVHHALKNERAKPITKDQLHQLIAFNDEIKKQELQMLEYKHKQSEKEDDNKDKQNKLLVDNRLKTLENAAVQLSTYLESIPLVKSKSNNNHNIEDISDNIPKVESLSTTPVKKIKIKKKKYLHLVLVVQIY